MVNAAAFPGFKVSIWSNRRCLPEYEDSALDNSGVTTSRYVRCTANTEFEIVVEFDKYVPMKTGMMDCRIYVDGKPTEAFVKYAHDLHRGHSSYISSGVLISHTQILKYRFASLQYEEGTRSMKPSQVKDLGCITVKCHDSQYLGPTNQTFNNIQAFTTNQAVSEKNFKGQAVSNVVRYGAY